jgi:hypothetical protein
VIVGDTNPSRVFSVCSWWIIGYVCRWHLPRFGFSVNNDTVLSADDDDGMR